MYVPPPPPSYVQVLNLKMLIHSAQEKDAKCGHNEILLSCQFPRDQVPCHQAAMGDSLQVHFNKNKANQEEALPVWALDISK